MREQGAREKEEEARPPREDSQIQRPGMRREGRQLVASSGRRSKAILGAWISSERCSEKTLSRRARILVLYRS